MKYTLREKTEIVMLGFGDNPRDHLAGAKNNLINLIHNATFSDNPEESFWLIFEHAHQFGDDILYDAAKWAVELKQEILEEFWDTIDHDLFHYLANKEYEDTLKRDTAIRKTGL